MSGNKQKKENQVITAIVPLDKGYVFEDIFYTLATKAKTYKYISFLDSSLVPNRFSTYSYLAWEPEFVLKSSGIKNEIMDLHSGGKEKVCSNPLKFLEKILKKTIFSDTGNIYFDNLNTSPESQVGKKTGISNGQGVGQKSGINCGQGISSGSGVLHNQSACQKVVDDAGEVISPDYKGGFMGYFSYDLKNYIEKLPAKAKKDLKVPVFYLCYYLKFLAFNHKNGRCYFIKNYRKLNDGANCRVSLDRSSYCRDFFDDYKKKIDGDYNNNISRYYDSSTGGAAGLKTNKLLKNMQGFFIWFPQ